MFKDFFAKVYVINLDSRTDRLREITGELSRFGASINDDYVFRFPAIRPDCAAGFPTIGARGCFLSHLGVLEDAARTVPDKPVLVLEDDIAFSGDFETRAPEAFTTLFREDWWLFYGGYKLLDLPTAGLMRVATDDAIQQSHFVAFSPEAVRDAIEHLRAILQREPGHPDGGPMHVDGAYNWLRAAHPEKRTYAINPPFAFQRSSRSDVDPAKWYNRAPMIRDLVEIARQVRKGRNGAKPSVMKGEAR